MNRLLIRLVILFAALVAGPGAIAKKPGKVSSAASQRAISALLAASADVIPSSSTCHGDFGSQVPARVADLIAMELATMSRGVNRVAGGCEAATSDAGSACHVTVTHEYGEEVSSAEIRFKAVAGRADVSSLACVLTP